MKKIGIESEYFIAKIGGDIPVVVPTQLPHDASGILVEVRGKPGDFYGATFSFIEAYFHTKERLHEFGYKILHITRHKLDKNLRLDLARQFAKGIYKAQNIYSDAKTHRKNLSYHYAGMHIHFSDNTERTFIDKNGIKSVINIPGILDIPFIVRKMDEEYANIISDAHRNKGCYELKGDNFEYRSLSTFWIEELEDIESLLSVAKFAFQLMK
jgi:hypothetical protein